MSIKLTDLLVWRISVIEHKIVFRLKKIYENRNQKRHLSLN